MDKKLQEGDLVLFLSARWEKIIPPIQAVGYDFPFVTIHGGWFKIFTGWLKLMRLLFLHKRAAIFTDTADRIGLAAYLAARIMGRKLIYRARGDAIRESYISGSRFRVFVNTKLFFPALDGIIPCSAYLGKVAMKQFPELDSEKVIPVPLPLPENKIHGELKPADSRKPWIIIASKFHFLDKVKPLMEIAPVLADFFSSQPGFKCVVLGDGTYLEQVRQCYSGLGLNDNMDFRGFVSSPEEFYAKGFCLLHVSGLDGYPSVIDEARLNKLPVICSNTLGLPEMVKDGIDGFILSDNYSSFASIILSLQDTSNYKAIANRALQRVKDRNSKKRIGHDFINAVSIILHGSADRAKA